MRYATLSGKRSVPSLKTALPRQNITITSASLSAMAKSTASYLDRIAQEQEYSKQQAHSGVLSR